MFGDWSDERIYEFFLMARRLRMYVADNLPRRRVTANTVTSLRSL